MERKRVGRIVWIVVLVLIALALLVFFDVPQKLGLVKGAGARFTDLTHERIPAEEIVAEAETKGFVSKNVGVYVFPRPDSGDAVVLASYDFSKEGVELSKVGLHHPAVELFILLGGGEKAKEHRISHVGAEFRDEDGNLIISAAAATADIRELQEGKITEEVFINERLSKAADYPNYVRRAYIPF